MSYEKSQDISLGKYFCKFNISLIQDDKYFSEMKDHINFIKSSFDKIFENNSYSRLDLLKYEIHKFTMRYAKTKAREIQKKIKSLEENLRTLELDLKMMEIYYTTTLKKGTKYDLWGGRQ